MPGSKVYFNNVCGRPLRVVSLNSLPDPNPPVPLSGSVELLGCHLSDESHLLVPPNGIKHFKIKTCAKGSYSFGVNDPDDGDDDGDVGDPPQMIVGDG